MALPARQDLSSTTTNSTPAVSISTTLRGGENKLPEAAPHRSSRPEQTRLRPIRGVSPAWTQKRRPHGSAFLL